MRFFNEGMLTAQYGNYVERSAYFASRMFAPILVPLRSS